MVPYMWRRPSLICSFIPGESGSMDDWYPTRQLVDYLNQTPQDSVGVEMEMEMNRYHCCVDSRQGRNTTFPCLETAKRLNQGGQNSFSSADEWNVRPNLIHLAKPVGTKAFALQPWTWQSSFWLILQNEPTRKGKKSPCKNDKIKKGNKLEVFMFWTNLFLNKIVKEGKMDSDASSIILCQTKVGY